jgi:hypothetical protein
MEKKMKPLDKVFVGIGFTLAGIVGIGYVLYRLFQEPEKLVMKILYGRK